MLTVIETKGLIVQEELNRKLANQSLRIDPKVEIRLERIFGDVCQTYELEAVKNKRNVKWGTKIHPNDDLEKEVNFNFGLVNHSGNHED
jgi:hypothetical protein